MARQLLSFANGGLTRLQLKAARAMLNITARELAMTAGVAYSSVKYFECGRCIPIDRTVECLRQACEQMGVVFIPEGVQMVEVNYNPLLRLYDARRASRPRQVVVRRDK